MVVLWLKLPEIAVIVTVNVPAGVPGVVVVWDEEDERCSWAPESITQYRSADLDQLRQNIA
jgi:hypothetical protein